jgi:hypothetical protein
MKLFLSTMFFAFITITAIAQEGAVLDTTPPGPYIQFTEKSYDFGDIYQGDKVAYTFNFTNTGDSPIVISNVQTTCGCTASCWPREPIAPGKSNKIDITFNSAGKIGMQNKVITIISNSVNNPERVKIVTNILVKPAEKTEG